MLNKPIALKSSALPSHRDGDIAQALAAGLALEIGSYGTLDDALYHGLDPIVAEMKEGHLTEEQAAIMIEMLLGAYVSATINEKFESLFQGWAEKVMEAGNLE